ncbi:hypothetical protein [Tenacibaculum piscium]|uniref:hypothetical protein n=1 Tax=Tenacibaculum piscium TaxID=1458515 RepID=UPI001F188709|nr:hypothetical protein [Tenacibaculum piscium]
MSTLNLVEEALDFEKNYKSFRTRNDKIIASRKAKEIVLAINEIYKKNRDKKLMDIMKRITLIKQKIEKRLKGRL